ncbi:MAG: ABC transporter ATP-binding protein [Actinobacteria bacterium]|nr:ABC transporter ATP-binding protein [Actinomycetota bacterium]
MYKKNIDKLLEVTNLTVQLATRRGIANVVKNVSFDLGWGKTLGIVGESGCGKTMTVRSIIGLNPQPPTKIINGLIKFDNINLMSLKENQFNSIRGKEISIIFQEPTSFLDPVFTVGSQVSEVLSSHIKNISNKDIKYHVIELFKKVGIPSPEKRFYNYPHQLSGGMAQRILIACAIAITPKLLICDEPTTALDVTIQKQVLNLLEDLKNEKGMSIIFVSHNLAVIFEICDEVVVMYAGEIVEKGAAADIFNKPKHPYTEALLKSLPTLNKDIEKLEMIKGYLPDIFQEVKGCLFKNRCIYADDDCLSEDIKYIQVGINHIVKCKRYE